MQLSSGYLVITLLLICAKNNLFVLSMQLLVANRSL